MHPAGFLYEGIGPEAVDGKAHPGAEDGTADGCPERGGEEEAGTGQCAQHDGPDAAVDEQRDDVPAAAPHPNSHEVRRPPNSVELKRGTCGPSWMVHSSTLIPESHPVR